MAWKRDQKSAAFLFNFEQMFAFWGCSKMVTEAVMLSTEAAMMSLEVGATSKHKNLSGKLQYDPVICTRSQGIRQRA